MKLYFGKSNWEVGHLALPAFCAQAKGDGFDAVELHIPGVAPSVPLDRICADAGVRLVAQLNRGERGVPDIPKRILIEGILED